MATEKHSPLQELLAKKEDPPKEKDPIAGAKKMASYSSKRVRQYFKTNGTLVKAVDGCFNPVDDEETAMLEHFVSIGFATKN